MFFKIYDTMYQGTSTTKFSHVGHIVSLALKDRKIYFIDPQAQKYIIVGHPFDKKIINDIYGQVDYYKFIDIVYVSNDRPLPYVDVYEGTIIPRLPEITHGGGRNSTRRRTHHRTRRTKQKAQ